MSTTWTRAEEAVSVTISEGGVETRKLILTTVVGGEGYLIPHMAPNMTLKMTRKRKKALL
jgi:hypothetical protein